MSRSLGDDNAGRSGRNLIKEARQARREREVESAQEKRSLAEKLTQGQQPDSWLGKIGKSGWGTRVQRDDD